MMAAEAKALKALAVAARLRKAGRDLAADRGFRLAAKLYRKAGMPRSADLVDTR